MWGYTKIKFTFAGDKWGNDFYISRQRRVTFPIPSLTEAIVNINTWNNSICFVNLSTIADNKTEFYYIWSKEVVQIMIVLYVGKQLERGNKLFWQFSYCHP